MLENSLALPVIAELLPSDRRAVKGAARVLSSGNKGLVYTQEFASYSAGFGSIDIIFVRHLSSSFHIRQACIFLEFAFGALGFGEKIKVEDYNNKAGIIFRYKK